MEVTRLAGGVGVSYTSGNDLTGCAYEPTSGAYTMPVEGTLNISVCHSAAANLLIRVGGNNLTAAALLADTFSTVVISLPSGTAFTIRFSVTGTVRAICVDAIGKGSF